MNHTAESYYNQPPNLFARFLLHGRAFWPIQWPQWISKARMSSLFSVCFFKFLKKDMRQFWEDKTWIGFVFWMDCSKGLQSSTFHPQTQNSPLLDFILFILPQNHVTHRPFKNVQLSFKRSQHPYSCHFQRVQPKPQLDSQEFPSSNHEEP